MNPRPRLLPLALLALLAGQLVAQPAPSRLVGILRRTGITSPGTQINDGSYGFLVDLAGGMSVNGGTFSQVTIGGSNVRIPTGGQTEFAEIDPATGAITLIAPLPADIGLVWLARSGIDLVNRVFYFVGTSTTGGDCRLIGLDVDNGAVLSDVCLSFPTMASGRLIAMEFDSLGGTLYAVALDPGVSFYLSTVDPATGLVTPTSTTWTGPVRLGVSGLDEANGPTLFALTADQVVPLSAAAGGPATSGPAVTPRPLGLNYDNLNGRLLAYGMNSVLSLNASGQVNGVVAATGGLTGVNPGSFDHDRLSGTYFFSGQVGGTQVLQSVDTTTGSVATAALASPTNFMCTRFVDDLELLALCGAGNVGTGIGLPPVDVLLVNGGAGGLSRVVTVGIGQPIAIDVLQPPSFGPPARFFVAVSTTGLPSFQSLYVSPIGSACIGGTAGFFLLADTFNSGLPVVVPATPAPWTLDVPGGLGAPTTLTLQGVIEDTNPYGLAFTNAVGLIVQ